MQFGLHPEIGQVILRTTMTSDFLALFLFELAADVMITNLVSLL
jgi:hypothetical protein